MFTLLDLCVSSLRRGHANLLCIVPILTDDPPRESKMNFSFYSTIGFIATLPAWQLGFHSNLAFIAALPS